MWPSPPGSGGPAPGRRSAWRRRGGWSRSSASWPAPSRAGPRGHRNARHLRRPMGRVAVVDRPGWIRANVDGFRVVLEPLVEQLRERSRRGEPVPARLGDQRGGIPGDRHAGRADPGLPGRPGARPVRAVPAPGDRPGGRPAPGPADPGRAEHRHGRARARRGPARLPALGVPARGDPPAAVHRRAVAARLRAGADDRVPAGLGTGPGGDPAAAALGGGRGGGGGARR